MLQVAVKGVRQKEFSTGLRGVVPAGTRLPLPEPTPQGGCARDSGKTSANVTASGSPRETEKKTQAPALPAVASPRPYRSHNKKEERKQGRGGPATGSRHGRFGGEQRG